MACGTKSKGGSKKGTKKEVRKVVENNVFKTS